MKLAALIRGQVASGELAPGDRLSMRVLCGKTGRSRQTVGKAMLVLEREGLIYRNWSRVPRQLLRKNFRNLAMACDRAMVGFPRRMPSTRADRYWEPSV